MVFKFLKLILLDFWFFQHGGDVNATDHTGQTALHWSAVRGAIQVAELLLQEGARVDATDMYGYQVHISSLTTRPCSLLTSIKFPFFSCLVLNGCMLILNFELLVGNTCCRTVWPDCFSLSRCLKVEC